MTNETLLTLSGLTKQFPGVLANDNVSFEIKKGEIHALLGENGAGKSTLVKIIYGVNKPDAGTMLLNGIPFSPTKPSEARAQGIGMVFQHFSLFEALTIAENIELGISPELAKNGLRERIIDMSKQYGLELDPDRLIGSLSVGVRQRVEIVRCLLQDPQLIIMDEPTSVLTPQEVDVLFQTLQRLRNEGRSILYISHKLEEIRALCEHATILRGGKVVATCTPAEESAKSLAEMMIGSSLTLPQRETNTPGDVRLSVEHLSLKNEDPFGADLQDINFEVKSGEIFGIAGVAGNGQNKLMEALIGERFCDGASKIQLDGKEITRSGPNDRRKLGMCFIPEERLGHGAVPDMSLWENTIVTARERRQLSNKGFINIGAAHEFAEQVVNDFDVRTAGIEHAARSLSGGNLQKFIVGRELLQSPAVLIASQPTWGVDAGAASSIHQMLLKIAREGTAILLISQDLDELFAISDRIAVIANGKLSKPENVKDLTIEKIGLDMGGQSQESEIHAEA